MTGRPPRPSLALPLLAMLAGGPGCGTELPATPPITTCNGHESLCGRRYDDLSYAGTHNAYSTIAEHFGVPNQNLTMTRQLEGGIRVLHLEAQRWDDGAALCHALCAVGSKPLADGLGEVVTFLAANPGEVVTLLLESGDLTPAEVTAALDAAGATTYLHPHDLGAPWPTLRQLIDRGERLVLFVDHEEGAATRRWWLPRWRFTFQTPWDNRTPEDFLRCHADRGQEGNPLYTVDVYQEDLVLPKAEHDALVNRNPFLVNRLRHCRMETGRRPNFVLVNFFDVSDVVRTVEAENGLDEIAPDWDAFPSADGGAPPDLR